MGDTNTPLPLSEIEPKMEMKGTIRKIELAGAIVDIGAEKDALLHISHIKPGRVNNVRDFLTEDQKVTVWVRRVDTVNGRIDVTMIRPPDVDWDELAEGQVYHGKVVRIEKFGAFVDIGAERPGLVHISELSTGYVNKPEDVVAKSDTVEVVVIGVDRRKNQIDLSMKALGASKAAVDVREEKEEEQPTAMALALQRALSRSDDNGGPDSDADGPASESGRRSEQEDILRRTLEQHGQS
jgi:small subunit ribosomal protein S1